MNTQTCLPTAVALLLALALALPAPVVAEPAWYRIDPVHTRVLFFVDHAGFSRSIGLFRTIDGGLWFDRADWRNSRVDLCLPVDGLDMGDRAWERTLRNEDFFHARRHPTICFESTRVELVEPPSGRLHGVMTVRGERVPVAFDFTVNDERRDSLTFRRRLGVSATATVSRSAFGMDRDRNLIGDRVEIVIEMEARLATAPADEDGTQATGR